MCTKHAFRVIGFLFSCYSFLFFCIWMNRDGERVDLYTYAHCIETDCMCKSSSGNTCWDVCSGRTSAVTLRLHKGFYHERFQDIVKVSLSTCLIHSFIRLYMHGCLCASGPDTHIWQSIVERLSAAAYTWP